MDHFARMQTLPTFLIDKVLETPAQTRQKVLKITQWHSLRKLLYYYDAEYRTATMTAIKKSINLHR